VERGGGDQVDRATEDGGELVGQLLDLPAEAAARLQIVEHVDLAVRGGGPACDGAEDAQLSDPIPAADVGETRLVDRHSGNRRQVVKVIDRPMPDLCHAGRRAGNDSGWTARGAGRGTKS
jgi:hypothetical protein